jgi:hypothetical protein
VGDLERRRALEMLGRAASEGRFTGSGLYEEEVHRVAMARTGAELDQITGGARLLIPAKVRNRVLAAIASAHVAGQLDFEEFLARSDRAHAPLSYADAAALVGDLGLTVRAPGTRRERRWLPRRIVRPALVGGAAGAGLVALPVLVAFPAEFFSWLPVMAFTGTFAAAGTVAVVAVAPLRQRALEGLAADRRHASGGHDDGQRPAQPGAIPWE